MTMTSNATPTRKQERIDSAICSVCFAAIPNIEEQKAAHLKWHEDRRDPRLEKAAR